jgi:pyruvate/2-oxoglutarate dehydrogenase complex dihydrolipoamide acyltransferase (E2) component
MVVSRRTSAHVTTVYEIDMTRIAKLREQHKDDFAERTGTKLTFMPFIAHATVAAIRQFPIVNSSVEADSIHYHRNINLDGLGEPFSKTYYIQQTTHKVDGGGYRTRFKVKETSL